MGWSRFLGPKTIDPLDPVCWDELLAAVAERRLAAGLPRSAAVTQFRRDIVAARCRTGDVNGLWSPLAADIRELAPLFYHGPALEENGAIHTTAEPLGPHNATPLVPAPATVDAYLPALFHVPTALSPYATAAKRALFQAFLALNRMHLLKLTPWTLPRGTYLDKPADMASALPFALVAYANGEFRRDTSASGIYGRTFSTTNWIAKADLERYGEDVRYWQILKAVPYLVRKNSYYTGDLFCYAAIGGTLRVHAVYDLAYGEYVNDAVPAYDDDDEPLDVDYSVHVIDEPTPVIHDTAYWLSKTLRTTVDSSFGGPGDIEPGWNDLGEIPAGTVRTGILPAETPDEPEPDVTDSRAAVIAAEFPDDDPADLFQHSRTVIDRRWRIDCALLDLTAHLDKHTAVEPKWEE